MDVTGKIVETAFAMVLNIGGNGQITPLPGAGRQLCRLPGGAIRSHVHHDGIGTIG